MIKSLFLGISFLFVIGRANAQNDGLFDSTFNSNGKKTISLGSYTSYGCGAIQSDGKIIAGGTFNSSSNFYDFLLTRFNSNGTLDNSFGNLGHVSLDFYTSWDQIMDIKILPSGKIIALGKVLNGSNLFDFAIMRFKSNGIIDSTFGNMGKLVVDFATTNDEAVKMAMQSDGKIVAIGSSAGSISGNVGVMRCDSNGVIDNSFGTNGMIAISLPAGAATATDLAIQNDGKIIISAVQSLLGLSHATLFRLNSNGNIDNTFAANGFYVHSQSNVNTLFNSIIILVDGSIVAAGVKVGSSGDILISKFNANGSLNSSFAVQGEIISDLGNQEKISSIQLQSNGKWLLCGNSGNSMLIGRLNSDGTIDATFGTNGYTIDAIGVQQISLNSMVQTIDKKVVCFGSTSSDGLIVSLHNSQSTGIIEMSLPIDDLVIFPNPARDQITLEASNKITEINITNEIGQCISLPIVQFNSNTSILEISALPKGLYFLICKNIKGEICNRSFCKW